VGAGRGSTNRWREMAKRRALWGVIVLFLLIKILR
jgi:hypothetical protein